MTSGKPGDLRRAARPARVDGEEQRREQQDRREELRPAERLPDRAPPERDDDARVHREPLRGAWLSCHAPRPRPRRRAPRGALEVPAGLLDEHVVERRLDEVERLDREAGLVERADDRARCPARRPRAATSARRPFGRQQLAEAAEHLGDARRCRRRRAQSSSRGLPTSAFSVAGRPLGGHLARRR